MWAFFPGSPKKGEGPKIDTQTCYELKEEVFLGSLSSRCRLATGRKEIFEKRERERSPRNRYTREHAEKQNKTSAAEMTAKNHGAPPVASMAPAVMHD